MKKNYLFLTIITFVFTSNLTLSQTTETENFDSAVNGTEYDLSSESTPGGFWNGSDEQGNQVSSGLYLFKFSLKGNITTGKITYLK